MKNTNETEESNCTVEETDEGNAGCQVRRKIEEYLERRRSKDELGDVILIDN